MKSRSSARSLPLALGLIAGMTSSGWSQPADPIRRPLWQNDVTQTTVLDSLPARRSQYQLISFPLDPSPNTVSAIFNELGAYNNEVYRLGHWDPTRTGADKYVELGDASRVTHGHGYWFVTRDSVRVRFDGTAATDTVELALSQGANGSAEWNQLGNPFPFNSAVTNWRVVKRDSLLTLGQASSQTWIEANMRTWNPALSQYTASGTIPRGAGFWSRLVDPDTSRQWTRWLPMDTTGNAGYWSTVRMDSRNNPHISFFFNSQLRYVTRNRNTWTRRIVEVPGNFGNSETAIFSNIELDSLDLPYIAEMQWSPFRPAFTRQLANGSWTPTELIEPGPTNNGWGIKLKLFHGQPRVAYCDRGSAGGPFIKYAEKTVSGWNVVTVSDVGNVQNQISHDLGFDLAANGVPHIATASRNSPTGLRYFTRVGTNWITELVDSLAVGSTGHAPSLVVDATGVPHISYFDQQNVDLKYARKSGANWVVETVDATGNTGNFSEILIQRNGQPAIAYLEYSSMGVPTRIRYAYRTAAGSWQIETVDDISVSSGQAYLGATIDRNGNPVVSYQGSPAHLRYAEKIRGTWRLKIPPVPSPEPPVAGDAKPEGAAWAVAVTARQDGRAAEPLYLGVAGDEAITALRSAKAPAPPTGGMLSLSVPRGTEEYVRDFQTHSETVRWSFRTEGGVAPGEQTLDFAGFDLPAGMKLFLSDPEHGWTREVGAGESVTLAARPRTLELVATTSPDVPATTAVHDGLAFAYPNPFGRTTGLAFTLARRADLRVDLFDVTGRRVRTLERSGAAAGEHVLTWDGRDDGGRLLPSGVYLAAWKAGAAHGSRRLVKVE